MANFIPDELINQIREANDIVEVISEYLPIKKKGKSYMALCPFHPEKTPSFSVSQERQIYHCFGCGKGGNVYTFLMEHEKLSFYEALRLLAKKANISLPQKPVDREKIETLDQLYYANQVANEYFQLSLTRSKRAKDYLHNRGFTKETIELFSLGYAPSDWEGLIKFSEEKGLKTEILLSSGLVVEREKKEGCYDRFRDRITFPIFNLSQKIVGFGGRILEEKGESKYLNSPESPIYNKGKILYGLHLSKEVIREKNTAVLVEGYIDLISLYQAGIKNVVAALGTSFTQDQARLISRYAEKIYLLFDSDRAGESAVFRSVDLLFDAGVEVMIVVFPSGEDPDSFVRKSGLKGIAQKLREAKGFIEYKKDTLPVEFNSLPMKEQEKIIKELADTANRIKNQLWKGLFINKVAKVFRINEKIVLDGIKGLNLKETAQKLKPEEKLTGIHKLERELLKLLIEESSLISQVKTRISKEDFYFIEDSELYEMILNLYEAQGKFTPAALIDKTENQKVKELISQIATLDLGMAEPQLLLEDYIKRIELTKKNNQIKKLKDEIKNAWNKGDKKKAEELTVEIHNLMKK
ncbi:MAG: DNA primase [candidate division Zixibacteria bacterium]|nr:DNA primase [candidate division Zixibacteria bacterium]